MASTCFMSEADKGGTGTANTALLAGGFLLEEVAFFL